MENSKVPARNYRELVVWQEGIQLAKDVYKLTEKFPRQETYALADQIRRAVVSVPSNIAEGKREKRRETSVDFCTYHSAHSPK